MTEINFTIPAPPHGGIQPLLETSRNEELAFLRGSAGYLGGGQGCSRLGRNHPRGGWSWQSGAFRPSCTAYKMFRLGFLWETVRA